MTQQVQEFERRVRAAIAEAEARGERFDPVAPLPELLTDAPTLSDAADVADTVRFDPVAPSAELLTDDVADTVPIHRNTERIAAAEQHAMMCRQRVVMNGLRRELLADEYVVEIGVSLVIANRTRQVFAAQIARKQ